MAEKIYEIYRGNELIGNLHLQTIFDIHGSNIDAICEITNRVFVRTYKRENENEI